MPDCYAKEAENLLNLGLGARTLPGYSLDFATIPGIPGSPEVEGSWWTAAPIGGERYEE